MLGAEPGSGGGFGAITGEGADTRCGIGGGATGAFAIGGGTAAGEGVNGARDTTGTGAGMGGDEVDDAEAAWAAVLTGGIDGECGA